jgi:hypothetical protein
MDEQGSLCSASEFFMLSRREEDFQGVCPQENLRT